MATSQGDGPIWRRRAQLTMAVLVVIAAATGTWAEFDPTSFYRSFPGAGHHWLPRLGPYNEHMFRDFGSLNLALAAASAYAAATGARAAVIAAAAAWEAYGVPHLAFHALNTEGFAAMDVTLNLVSLTLLVVLPATAWVFVARADRLGGGPPQLPRQPRARWPQ